MADSLRDEHLMEPRAFSELIAAWPGSERWKDRAPEELEAAVHAAFQVASDHWPGVEVDQVAFARFVAARLPSSAEPVSVINAVRLDELYLAFACLNGSAKAMVELERRYMREAALALKRL